MNILPKLGYFFFIIKSVIRVIQYFCLSDRHTKGGTFWISRKRGILEKGEGIDLEKWGGI